MVTNQLPENRKHQPMLPPDAAETAKIRAAVALAAQGMSDREIARRLGCSLRTVTRRFAAAMTMYDARSRFHLGFVVASDTAWLGDTA